MADRRSRGEERYSRRDERRKKSDNDSPERKRHRDRSRSPRERLDTVVFQLTRTVLH